MKEKFENKSYVLALVLFILTIILNYMSAMGILLPYTQKEVSDTYQNLLTPAGTAFSIWGLIYIGMALSFALPFIKKLRTNDKNIYYRLVMRGFILWEVFNIIWTVFFTSDLILPSLIAIILYTLSLVLLTKKLSNFLGFSRKYKIFLTIPLGLHTGWLTFASFTNIMVLLVKYGLDGYSALGVLFTIVMMAIALGLLLLLFNITKNAYITVPGLWAIFWIIIKNSPSSDFAYSSPFVMVIAIILFILGIIGHILVLKNRKI